MGQRLRAPVVLLEDQGSIPSTIDSDSQLFTILVPRNAITLVSEVWPRMSYTYMLADKTLIYI